MAYYKGIKVNSFGFPVSDTNKGNRIKNKNRKRGFYLATFPSTFSENSPKDLILMYDVVEAKKKERDWFRRQLKNFDYTMIQRSVWVGPSPLPKDFLDYVKSLRLESNLKTFKLAKPYTGRERVFK
jgi:DNA-binding transcriptional regulator PaaX